MGDEVDGRLSNTGLSFRAKLIEDFQLTHINDGSSSKKVFTYDVYKHPEKLLKEYINTPVAFDSSKLAVTRKLIIEQNLTKNDRKKIRRQARFKNRHVTLTPVDLWAHWLAESKTFTALTITCILLNAVFIAIQLDYGREILAHYPNIYLLLFLLDDAVCVFLVTRVVIEWINNFKEFWHNIWNIIDLLVTALAVLPYLVLSVMHPLTMQLYKRKVEPGSYFHIIFLLRVFVCIKLCTRVPKVRALIQAVAKASRSLVMVSLLFIIIAYITAVFGITFFDMYALSTREDVVYNYMFRSIDKLLLLLFRLFTQDGWLAIYKDMTKVVDKYAAGAYIVTWVVFATYIIGCMFIGILVSNFIQIRKGFDSKAQSNRMLLRKWNEKKKAFPVSGKKKSLLASASLAGESKKLHAYGSMKTVDQGIGASSLNLAFETPGRKNEGITKKTTTVNGHQSTVLRQKTPAKKRASRKFGIQRKKRMKRRLRTTVHPKDVDLSQLNVSQNAKVHPFNYSTMSTTRGDTANIAEDRRNANFSLASIFTSETSSRQARSNIKMMSSEFGEGNKSSTKYLAASSKQQSTHEEAMNYHQMVKGFSEQMRQFDTTTTWCRDVYFQYLILLEHLQKNVAERKKLQTLAKTALLSFVDSGPCGDPKQDGNSSIFSAECSKSASNRGADVHQQRKLTVKDTMVLGRLIKRWRNLTKLHKLAINKSNVFDASKR